MSSVSSQGSASVLQVKELEVTTQQKALGLAAALMMVLVWSSYFMSLRIGAASPLTTYEIALFRFAIPGLLLAPLFFKHLAQIRQVPKLYLAGMLVGGGLPFFWLGAMGMQSGQVAEGSTLIPGVAPLFVTGLAVVIYRQPLSKWRLLGLLLIATGVAAFLMDSLLGDASLQAQGIFLVASFFWALFAISVRQCGLSPLVAASVVTLPTGLALVAAGLIMQPELGWQQLSSNELLAQMFTQGFGAGLASSFLFAFAISRMGAEVTSAIGSMTPVAASAIALYWLGEVLSENVLLGITLISVGVVLASGIVRDKAS